MGVGKVGRVVIPHGAGNEIRKHCLALLASGTVIGVVAGVQIRTFARGRWLIVATEPLEMQAAPAHWSLDLLECGERRFAAHWREPNASNEWDDALTFAFLEHYTDRRWVPRSFNVLPAEGGV